MCTVLPVYLECGWTRLAGYWESPLAACSQRLRDWLRHRPLPGLACRLKRVGHQIQQFGAALLDERGDHVAFPICPRSIANCNDGWRLRNRNSAFYPLIEYRQDHKSQKRRTDESTDHHDSQ